MLSLLGCPSPPGASGHPVNLDVVAPVLTAAELATFRPVHGELLYVPAYASIYNATAHRSLSLAVTLSVRNTDPERTIVLRSARYYDTAGKLLKEVVPTPRRLPPLATFEYVVDLTDDAGGSGANFLVEWVADDAAVTAPLVETVNLQTVSGQGVSFTSRAVTIRKLGGS